MYDKILAKQLWPSTVPFQTTWVEQMMMIKKAQKKNLELYSYKHDINKGSCNRYLQAHR